MLGPQEDRSGKIQLHLPVGVSSRGEEKDWKVSFGLDFQWSVVFTTCFTDESDMFKNFVVLLTRFKWYRSYRLTLSVNFKQVGTSKSDGDC